jgi:uracil-DNA glycosylase family 4
MTELRLAYLDAMGIPSWVLRDRVVYDSNSTADETAAGDARVGERRTALQTLEATVASCESCALHRTRTQTVFGVGNPSADLLIVGEAPGADEDRQGKPFVGRAGQLLNRMLAAIQLSREQVYIANVLKCRPPNNRDPKPEEATACNAFLERQIELIEPRVILAVGRISAQWLLQSDRPIGSLRGVAHRFGADGIALVATYHPAYLLRSPKAKAKAWQDLILVSRLLQASR